MTTRMMTAHSHGRSRVASITASTTLFWKSIFSMEHTPLIFFFFWTCMDLIRFQKKVREMILCSCCATKKKETWFCGMGRAHGQREAKYFHSLPMVKTGVLAHALAPMCRLPTCLPRPYRQLWWSYRSKCRLTLTTVRVPRLPAKDINKVTDFWSQN